MCYSTSSMKMYAWQCNASINVQSNLNLQALCLIMKLYARNLRVLCVTSASELLAGY